MLQKECLVETTKSPLVQQEECFVEKPDAKEKAKVYAEKLRALADPVRLRILFLLLQYGRLITVEEIVNTLGREEEEPLAQPTISHHLRILRDGKLIDSRKRGLNVFYFVRTDAFNTVNELWCSLSEAHSETVE